MTAAIVQKTAQSPAEKNDVISELYFAKSQRHLINMADRGQLAAEEVTVIYLSFTNVRVSITLPGGCASIKGGSTQAHNRKYYRLPLRCFRPETAVNRNSPSRQRR
jgi:hypothetical protein